MTRTVYRYTFEPEVPLLEAEETLILSVYGAEGIHGAARVRMEVGYLVSEESRAFVVDASTSVGETVVQLFTGYITKEFGEDSFKVERIVDDEVTGDVPAAPLPPPPDGPAPAGVAR